MKRKFYVMMFANFCLLLTLNAEVINFNEPALWDKKTFKGNSSSMTAAFKGTVLASPLVKLDKNKNYFISGTIKTVTNSPKGRFLFGCKIYDAKGALLQINNCNFVPGSYTEIIAPVKATDTVIKVKNASKWRIHPFMVIAFNAKKDLSDLPNRNIIAVTPVKIEKVNDGWNIHLKSPVKKALPVGTAIREHISGGNLYFASGNDTAPIIIRKKKISILKGVSQIRLLIMAVPGAGSQQMQLQISDIKLESIKNAAPVKVRRRTAPTKKFIGSKTTKKKLIECSWSTPDTAYLRKHIKEIEASAPYDGIRIGVNAVGKDENGATVICNSNTAFTNKLWKYEWFKPALDDMKNTKFTKFTDNFLQMTTSPGNVTWFDDEGWKCVCNNYALMARFAKESGMVGICLDPESYSRNPLFRFNPALGKTAEETADQARKRGKQFGEAIFKEFPDIKFFLFSLFENNLRASENPELNVYNPTKYAMAVPFINGILDAMPPKATLLEGFGSTGYHINRPASYTELKYIVQNRYLNFIDPKNRNKYLTQVQMAPGTYLDAYFFNKQSHWYKSLSAKQNRLDILQRNLAGAFQFTDEYIWTWSECGNWWEWEHSGKNKWMNKSRAKAGGGKWEKVVPGITDVVRKARNLTASAEDFIARCKPENLVKINSGFETAGKQKNKIPGWSVWKTDGDINFVAGKGRNKSQGLVIKNTENTICFGHYIRNVKPGQRYIIVGYAKQSHPDIFLALRTDFGSNFTHDCYHMEKHLPFSQQDTDGFKKIVAVVDIPLGADYLRPTPMISSMQDGDEIIFDDFAVYLWD